LLRFEEIETPSRTASKLTSAVAVGGFIGLVVSLASWAVAVGSSSWKQAAIALNYPVIMFLEWYAHKFEGGNMDHMLGFWLLLFPGFWVLLGAAGGALCYFLCSRLARSSEAAVSNGQCPRTGDE
jgi:hypothetical protein